VYALAFSPDGTTLATGGYGTTVALWDVTHPAAPVRTGTLTGHTDVVRAVAFTPDGRHAVTAAADGHAAIWDVANSSAPRQLSPLVDPNAPAGANLPAILAAAVSPDGRSVVTGSEAGVISHFDISRPDAPVPTTTDVRTGVTVTGLAYADGTDLIATTQSDSAFVVDPARSSSVLTSVTVGWNTWSVAVSPTDRTIAIGAEDGVLRQTPWPGLIASPTGSLQAGATFAHSRVLATGDDAGQLALWRLSGEDTVTQLSAVQAHDGSYSGLYWLAVRPDDKVLASSGDGGIRFWDVSDLAHPRQVGSIIETDTLGRTIEFSPDGRLLAVGSGHDIAVWDVSDPVHPVSLAHDDTGHRADALIERLVFSPDGALLASAGSDRQIVLWDLRQRGRLTSVGRLGGFTGKINDIGFAPRGRTLAAGGDGRIVYLYDVTNPVRPAEIGRLAPHNGAILKLRFSSDGRTLATGGAEIRLWDVSNLRAPKPRGDFLTGSDTWDLLFTADNADLIPVLHAPAIGVLDLDVAEQAGRICAAAGDPITREEWRRYLPDLAFRPPCTAGRTR